MKRLPTTGLHGTGPPTSNDAERAVVGDVPRAAPPLGFSEAALLWYDRQLFDVIEQGNTSLSAFKVLP